MSGPITTAMNNIRGLWEQHAPTYLRMPAIAEGTNTGYGKPKRRFSEEDRMAVIDRLRKGESPHRIAKDYGCCESKVRYYKTKL